MHRETKGTLCRKPHFSRMPRFFFDFDNGGTFLDEDGAEFPSIEAARKEALKALCDAARDYTRDGSQGRLVIRVRDAEKPILEVSATFEEKLLVK